MARTLVSAVPRLISARFQKYHRKLMHLSSRSTPPFFEGVEAAADKGLRPAYE